MKFLSENLFIYFTYVADICDYIIEKNVLIMLKWFHACGMYRVIESVHTHSVMCRLCFTSSSVGQDGAVFIQ